MVAIASGLRKKSSGLSGIILRVRGMSITPSTMMTATWMPAGQRLRAMLSASTR